ncbi:hypothetical protein [Roseibium sp.]|uniref:hypothetical protein n=1 Tax=Roseibium sp. TaxID=1936156 RepID=UPI003A97EF9F
MNAHALESPKPPAPLIRPLGTFSLREKAYAARFDFRIEPPNFYPRHPGQALAQSRGLLASRVVEALADFLGALQMSGSRVSGFAFARDDVLKFLSSLCLAELASGQLMFAGGLPEIRADPFSPEHPFLGFRHFDFYLANGNVASRLSQLDAYVLTSMSVADNTLMFHMFPNAEFEKRNGEFRSKVYQATLNQKGGSLGFTMQSEKPFIIHGDRRNSKPFLAPDGAHIVFMSARSEPGGYIYDFVVADVSTKAITNVITTAERPNANTGSLAVFTTGKTLKYMTKLGNKYQFWERGIDDSQSRQISEVEFIEIIKN